MILKNDPGYITGSKSGFLSSDKMPFLAGLNPGQLKLIIHAELLSKKKCPRVV
jgi:hypothetical protein